MPLDPSLLVVLVAATLAPAPAAPAFSSTRPTAPAVAVTTRRDDFTGSQLDAFIRGVASAKALKARAAAQAEGRQRDAAMKAGQGLNALSEAQMEKITAHMECRQSAMEAEPELMTLMMKAGDGSAPAAERKDAATRMSSLYRKRCGAPPTGFSLLNPDAPAEDAPARVDYRMRAMEASGLGDRTFARMEEIAIAYVHTLRADVGPAAAAKLFNASELAVLRQRKAKLQAALNDLGRL